MMESKRFFLLLLLIGLAVFPFAARAQVLLDITRLANQTLVVLYIILTIVFVIALVVFSWGIVKYLSAAGDATKIKDARQILWWGILGIFVLASIWGLTFFIARNLDIDQGSGVFIPPTVRNPAP